MDIKSVAGSYATLTRAKSVGDIYKPREIIGLEIAPHKNVGVLFPGWKNF